MGFYWCQHVLMLSPNFESAPNSPTCTIQQILQMHILKTHTKPGSSCQGIFRLFLDILGKQKLSAPMPVGLQANKVQCVYVQWTLLETNNYLIISNFRPGVEGN